MASKNEQALQANNANALVEQNVFTGLGFLSDFVRKEGPALGLECLNSSDFKLQRIRLLQPTSSEVTEGHRPGFFYNTLTKESYEKITCTMLYLTKSRVMWRHPFRAGEEPICRSLDGINGSKFGLCANCQNCKWINKESPKCNFAYQFLGLLDNDLNSPFKFIVSGTGVSPTKDFLNTIATTKQDLFTFSIEIGSELVKNEKGTFYKVTFPKKENIRTLVDLVAGSLGIDLRKGKPNPEQYKQLEEAFRAKYAELENITHSYRDMFSDELQNSFVDSFTEDAIDVTGETQVGLGEDAI